MPENRPTAGSDLPVCMQATAVPLYFGRGKRLATMEQRLGSFARPDDEMCSTPDCDMATTHAEMDHAQIDWGDGGFTDIRDEIHGQPEPVPVDPPRPELRQVIDLRDATPAELVVASALLDAAYCN
ncbi:hypothetical protein [Gordonia westfalica]|uniref:hypothetical protein n=1 Tax=Gordonia westfalica TaxID=158898 RepID=UPI00404A46FA